LNDAKTQRDNASQKVNSITDQLNSINTIVLPDGYVQAWKDNADDSIFQPIADKGFKINSYKNNEKEQTVMVETLHITSAQQKAEKGMIHQLHLTNEQQKDLTLWVACILNGVRQQFGFTGKNIVTDNSLKYAKVVADNYWDKFDHDTSALEKAEEAIGGGVWYSTEAIDLGYIPNETVSMDTLKESVYNSMLGMIFDDAGANWGHTAHLTGARVNGNSIRFGFSIDKNGVTHYESYQSNDNTTQYIPKDD